MNISVTGPISEAMEWTKTVLFRPFSLKKWLILGFCSFLAGLAQPSGCQFQGNFPSGSGGQGNGQTPEVLQRGWAWVSNETLLAIVIIVGVLLLLLGIMLLLQWLSSRGIFMFLDGILRNEAAVVEPWKEFKPDGNSLFMFRVCLLLFGGAGILLILAGCAIIAWPDINAGVFQSRALLATVIGAVLLIPFAILLGLVRSVLIDFAVPVIYRHQVSASHALSMLWSELIHPHIGHFILFYLMKILLGIAAATIAIAITCATCCLAALPYISSVILLPIGVFFRSYPIFFLAQFGDKWQVVPLETSESENTASEPPETNSRI